MANWCENDLRVRGAKKEIDRFLEFAKTDDSAFDFEKFVPIPEVDGEADHYLLWGTCSKYLDHFDCDWEDRDEQDADLLIRFDTKWSPPEPIIKKAGEMFPDLEFDLRYFEQGMGFHGILCIEKGEVTEEDCANYYGDRGG